MHFKVDLNAYVHYYEKELDKTMPLFDFKCEKCGAVKELIRGLGKAGEVFFEVCDACGGVMHKTISSGNFILKGKGWAKDGYSGSSE